MATNGTRTTLALPTDPLEAVDRAAQEGRARSRNAFVAAAPRRELAIAEAAAIDAAFAGMAEDTDHQAEAQAIREEFAAADWEAWRLGESRR